MGPFDRNRLAAFLAGVGAAYLYVRVDPFEFLSAPLATALASVPVGLCFYGITDRSWKASLASGACVGIGLLIGTSLDGASFL